MPGWGWALLILLLLAIPLLKAWRFYQGFRVMCAAVREEMGAFIKTRYPGAEVVREELGNLVVRAPDGSEKRLEMADIYTEAARLPAAGAGSRARTAVYERATAALFAPGSETALDPEAHRSWIKPLLVSPGDAPEGAVQNLIPELGLAVVYPIGSPAGGRFVREGDLAALGGTASDLHLLATENLARDFPGEMVASAVAGESTAIQFGDGFDAARLLLVPDSLADGQEVVALAPHRDMLLLMPTSTEPDQLRQGLALLKCEHPPLLEEHPVRVTAAGFALL